MLRGRGYRIVGSEDDCDILLLNTCSVRDAAEQKAIGKAAHAQGRKRRTRDFVLGILGCMAQNRGADAPRPAARRRPDRRHPEVSPGPGLPRQPPRGARSRRSGRRDRSSTSPRRPGPRTPSATISRRPNGRSPPLSRSSRAATCTARSASCPKTRGDERSRPMDDIVAECRELVGARRPRGHAPRPDRHQLRPAGRGPGGVRRSCSCSSGSMRSTGLERIRFTSPHPRGFRQDLSKPTAGCRSSASYVHLPLQSRQQPDPARDEPALHPRALPGDRRRPARGPARTVFLDRRHRRISRRDRGGFRGDTRSLFEAVNYDMAYVFKYSVRTGTPAADLPGQVPATVKEERNRVLLDLLAETRSGATGRSSGPSRRSWSRARTGPAGRFTGQHPRQPRRRSSRRPPAWSARWSRSGSPGPA